MGSYLTRQQMQARTKVEGLRDVAGETTEFWIDLSEDLLNTFNIDSSSTGFTNIAAWVVQKIAEHLFVQNEEQIVIAINTPFRSERLGSYSYNKGPRTLDQKKELFIDLPTMVQVAILRITKHITPLSVYTKVFREENHLTETGVRNYQDLLDIEIARISNSDGEF